MYNYVNYIYERVKHVRELKFKINDKETKIYNLIIRKISTSPTFPFFYQILDENYNNILFFLGILTNLNSIRNLPLMY